MFHFSSFLLLVIACSVLLSQNGELHLVRGDFTNGYSIETGKLTPEAAEANAAAKLSKGQDQQAWWTLAKAQWHDSAMQRFFKVGPLRAEEITKLAENKGNSENPWEEITSASMPFDDLAQTLEKLSTTHHWMSKDVKGTGKIEASMWTIIFRCRTYSSCKEGYMVPVISIPGTEEQPSFGTVWLPITTTVLVNAIPAYMLGNSVISTKPMPPEGNSSSELSNTINKHENLTSCNRSAILSYRSHVDASYGLLPASTCIQFKSDSSTLTLLIALSLPADNVTAASVDDSLFTTQEFLAKLQLNGKDSSWNILPFENCSKEAVLIVDQIPPDVMCHEKVCAYFLDIQCPLGIIYLEFMQSVAKLSLSCEDAITGQPLTAGFYDSVSCNGASSVGEVDQCTATVQIFNVDTGNIFRHLINRKSNWASSKGKNYHDFNILAPLNMSIGSIAPCFMTLTSSTIVPKSGPSSFNNAMEIRARAFLNSFIAEHNIAFTMDKGPAAEVVSFLGLVISTAISVCLSFVGPSFTNSLLKRICRKWPLLLENIQYSTSNKVIKVMSITVVCNLILSIACFSPVIILNLTEVVREKTFYTWDLGSEDLAIFETGEEHLRVVYFLSGKSKYESPVIIDVSEALAGFVCLLVLIFTIRRCKTILNRYSRLKTYESMDSAAQGRQSRDRDRREAGRRALRAIDMTKAESLEIKKAIELHRASDQNSPPVLSRGVSEMGNPGASSSSRRRAHADTADQNRPSSSRDVEMTNAGASSSSRRVHVGRWEAGVMSAPLIVAEGITEASDGGHRRRPLERFLSLPT